MVGFYSQGPVVYWHPFGGERHALWPTSPPQHGQVRDTVCGRNTTIAQASDVDWLAPTCVECLTKARAMRDARG